VEVKLEGRRSLLKYARLASQKLRAFERCISRESASQTDSVPRGLSGEGLAKAALRLRTSGLPWRACVVRRDRSLSRRSGHAAEPATVVIAFLSSQRGDNSERPKAKANHQVHELKRCGWLVAQRYPREGLLKIVWSSLTHARS
jgi:hypothetical protein